MMRLRSFAAVLRVLPFLAFACWSSAACASSEANRGTPSRDEYFTGEQEIELEIAIDRGDLAGIDRAVSHGAKVDALGRGGMTPLTLSMLRKNIRVFEKLLDIGANPNLRDTAGGSVMHLAAVADDSRWLKLALSHAGDPNLEGPGKRTPIFEAVSAMRAKNLSLLIEHRADLNHKDSTGNTALLRAAGINRYDLVYLLLEAGADYRIGNNWGRTLVDTLKTSRVDPNHELYRWQQRVEHWLRENGVAIDRK